MSDETIGDTSLMCCRAFEKMSIEWMKLKDNRKCMPHIKGHSDGESYRVNYCPSCGHYVRDLIIES